MTERQGGWQNPLSREFEISLDRLKRFARMVESMLISQSDSLKREVEAMAVEITNRHSGKCDLTELYEGHALDSFELTDDLPSILRYSVLGRADAAFEHYLVGTAKAYAQIHKPKIQLGDFAGTGLYRAQKYLKKVAEIHFPDDLPEWRSILRLHDLRNAIMHTDGQLDENHKNFTALKNWINETPGIEISGDNQVTCAAEFSDLMIGLYLKFSRTFDSQCGSLGLWEIVFPRDEVESAIANKGESTKAMERTNKRLETAQEDRRTRRDLNG